MDAAHKPSMSTPTLEAPTKSTFVNRDPDGRWGKGPGHDYSGEALSDTGTTEVLALHSEFIDESPINQEAAAVFTAEYPWATATDFEKAFFDIYTDDEYAAELADPDSQLNKSAKDATVLPSGSIAVFESLSGTHY